MLRQESSAELSSSVERLPPRMQSVMKLKLSGYSTQEIAELLSISSGAVRIATMRATQRLREIVGEGSQSLHSQNQQDCARSYEVSPFVVRNIVRLPDV